MFNETSFLLVLLVPKLRLGTPMRAKLCFAWTGWRGLSPWDNTRRAQLNCSPYRVSAAHPAAAQAATEEKRAAKKK